jgi:hypothetical protein
MRVRSEGKGLFVEWEKLRKCLRNKGAQTVLLVKQGGKIVKSWEVKMDKRWEICCFVAT